ncbi:MAG: CDP-glycerol glycerophosphotransferase family protein, partial [Clostridia bacterium]|nr:CDP-glycerol glycerophosphotransferase family protein [Clostridia bacterium]
NDPKVIMIAPSWQKDNIMDFCLDDLIMPLLQTDYRVILRPHPEYVKRFPDKMERLKTRYEKHLGPYFDIQTEYQKTESVYSADLVITDWSSIAQEFSYATKKPALFINTPMKIMNPEYQKIPLVPLDISLRDEIGRSVDLEQLDTLPALIESLMNEGEAWCRRIEQVVSDNIYDVGRAAEGGGRYIIETLSKKKHVQKENDENQNALLELDNTWEAMRSQLSQEEAVMLLKQLEDFQKITKEQEDDHA